MKGPEPVRITVTGIDADGDAVSLTSRGTLQTLPGGAWRLIYEETNLMDMETVRTEVTVEAGSVTVQREGTTVSTLVFTAQETFIGQYPTPVGTMQMRILTTQLEASRRGRVGRIRVAYQISLSTRLSPSEETTTRLLDIRFGPCAG